MAWTGSANLRGSYVSRKLDSLDGFQAFLHELKHNTPLKRCLGVVALAFFVIIVTTIADVLTPSMLLVLLLTGTFLYLVFAVRNFHGPMQNVNVRSATIAQNHRAVGTAEMNSHGRSYEISSPKVAEAIITQNADPGQSWTDLASRVSHEIRTPLNAVIGFSDLMEQELHGPLGSPQYSEYTRHIRTSGRAVLKSAEDTLALTSALARLETPSATAKIDLHKLIEDAWAFVADNAATRGITFTNTSPQNLMIIGDQITLRQVFINMLSDLITASRENGKIEFQTLTSGHNVAVNLIATSVGDDVPCKDSLDLCLVRALLEIHRAPLHVLHQPRGTRSLQTNLPAMLQHELFKF